MKITLVDIQQPEALFSLLSTFEAPVSCCGADLRNDPQLKQLICGMAAPGRGIPRLELSVSGAKDCARLLRYMREGGKTAA